MTQKQHAGKTPLLIVISVFFFWGFVAASNDILIPVFKEQLHLEQWQSQIVSFAFYVAYTVGAVGYLLISRLAGGDLLNRLGYRNGLSLGLVISAFGTFLFYPAALLSSFALMITGLFIVGLGFSLQQTVANPLVINLGGIERGSQRLSLAGGINNVGTTIGPLLVSLAIFGSLHSAGGATGIGSVMQPYLILGAAFLLVAVIIKFSAVPNQLSEATGTAAAPDTEATGPAIRFPQLWMGMIGIFVYVGVEVSTASNLPEFMRQEMHIETNQISPFISLYWASLMIGRWASSAGALSGNTNMRTLMRIAMPFAAFGFFLLVNVIAGNEVSRFYVYALVIPVMIAADFLSFDNPARQLLVYSLIGIAALCIGMFSSGLVSIFAFLSVGLFCSTLWPCIFTLAITGLGGKTNEGSSLLIMMIMGGGIISMLQGVLSADALLGIRWSYITGIACFAYLAFYAWRVQDILYRQGFSTGRAPAQSH